VLTWQQLLHEAGQQHEPRDIAVVSLAVARGLPGSEDLDDAACLEGLDKLARIVGQHTAAGAAAFRRHPEQFDHSWAVFRVMDMLTVLQRDLGFRYNPDLVDRDDFFADSRNLFLHGVLQTRMGGETRGRMAGGACYPRRCRRSWQIDCGECRSRAEKR
jgi:hypothetical protein